MNLGVIQMKNQRTFQRPKKFLRAFGALTFHCIFGAHSANCPPPFNQERREGGSRDNYPARGRRKRCFPFYCMLQFFAQNFSKSCLKFPEKLLEKLPFFQKVAQKLLWLLIYCHDLRSYVISI